MRGEGSKNEFDTLICCLGGTIESYAGSDLRLQPCMESFSMVSHWAAPHPGHGDLISLWCHAHENYPVVSYFEPL
jgi:hypothetical protein